MITPKTRKSSRKNPFKPMPVWSDDEKDEIVSDYVNGKSMTEIRKQRGCTHIQLKNFLLERQVFKRMPGERKISEDEEKEIVALYLDGWSAEKLAKKYNCSYDTIKHYAIANGVSLRGHKRIKFSPEQEAEIVRLYKEGYSLLRLAGQYDCSGPVIKRVLDRLYPERESTNRRFWLDKNKDRKIPIQFFSTRKHSATRNGTEWSITLGDINRMCDEQNGRCFYTGLQMRVAPHLADYDAHIKGDPLAISIDRRESSIGYIASNVVLCCRFINYAKNEYNEERFRQVLSEAAHLIVGASKPTFNPWEFGT